MYNMIINKAYKTELQVNNKLATYFEGCAGYARFVYNWALNYWVKEYERGDKRTGWMKLNTELTKLKEAEFKWMYDYSNWIRTYSIRNCDQAYHNFFRRVKQGKKPGFPKFKSKKRSRKTFTINGEGVKVTETKIRLPRVGWVNIKEHGYIPTNKKIVSATISESCGRWYISVVIEEEMPEAAKPEKVIGVDLGIKTLAVTSDGVFYENPKTLYKAEKRLKRLDRRLSRKQKGSKNREKAKLIRAKAYQKVARIRNHVLNEITTELAKSKQILVLEDLNVAGMQKNHHLARSISDASWSMFRSMLEYKCHWYGSELVIVNPAYTSQTCSNCGAIKSDLTLEDRTYKCECGLEIDRDLNAAINIKNRAKHAQINACGEEGKTSRVPLAASLKQEAGCEVSNA